MLCLQTSCHRCPSALHNRLVTSTPSLSPLSLIHHVRVDASSIAAMAWALAWSREPRPSREKRWRGHWPGRGGRRHADGGKTRRRSRRLRSSRRWRTGPVARGPPSREKRTYPTDTPSPRPAELSRRIGATEGLVPVATGLDPAKAATAPVIGIIIEFLPTGPHQTARGDAPDTTERHKLAQLRPIDRLHAHRL